MAQPYVGEIRMFAGNFAPAGWAFCQGQLLPISEYEALFNLIGTTYGGDGQSTFRLPDLQGRLPIHQGTGVGLSSRAIGEISGVEQVTLTTPQVPPHTHPLNASTAAASLGVPGGNVTAFTYSDSATVLYASAVTDATMASQSVGSSVGGNQPHENRMPYLNISFIISLFGLFPSQT
jgi:microcystin-dependent protein